MNLSVETTDSQTVFKVGDPVQLKFPAPKMSIHIDNGDGSYVCQWYSADRKLTLQSGVFFAEQLVPYQKQTISFRGF